MKTSLILDVAHGINIPGKQSPDGIHKEWKWSRDIIRMIFVDLLEIQSPRMNIHSPYLDYEKEPGLLTRVKYYNEISKNYDKTLMLSYHNDANHIIKCDKDGYGKGQGIAVWTSRGEDEADDIATFMFNEYKKSMPEQYFRTAYWLGKREKEKDPDYESDFTILAGYENVKPLYIGILLEVLFQNNQEDLRKLKSFDWNIRFKNITKKVILKTIIYLNDKK